MKLDVTCRSVVHSGVQLKEATLATHYVPSQCIPDLEAAIHDLGPKARDYTAVHKLLSSFEVSLCKSKITRDSCLQFRATHHCVMPCWIQVAIILRLLRLL